MNKLRLRKFATGVALLGSALTGLIPAAGIAQTATSATTPTATAPADESAVKLEKFVVTGSLIPFAADAPAVPVSTITSVDIERSGAQTSLLEVLRKTVPQFVGNGNLGATNANTSSGSTSGGSQLSLFNAQTLVLINGRRVAYAPVGASGGYQFVDVNLIPISAIERVDVVTDGASAIYGTDAISGVVNIILKSDFQGSEVGGRYAFSDNQGNYAERSAHASVGASSGKTSVTVSASWFKSDPLFNYERPYSNPTYGTGTFPGSVSLNSNTYYLLNPSLNAPPQNLDLTPAQLVAAGIYSGPFTLAQMQTNFNLSQYVTQIGSNERQAAVASFDHKVSDNVTAFGDFMYANTKTFTQLNAQPITASTAASNPNNPFNVTVTARNRFFAFPRTYANDTTSIRGVAGLKGEFGDGWNWEIAADYNRIGQDFVNNGLVDSAARVAAVSGGILNLFAYKQTPTALADAGIFGTALGIAESKLTTYDAKVYGKVFSLPAGDVSLAVGAEHRIETYSQNADRNSQAATFGWDSGTTLDPFDGSRKVDSVYAEIRVPIAKDMPGLHMLELSAAARHETYSDTEDPTVPKFSLRWLPVNDELAVSATFGKSFTAPTLFQLFGPGGIGYSDTLALTGTDGSAIVGQSLVSSGANPKLKPSKADNYSVQVIYSPKAIKGLKAGVSYSHVKQVDLVSSLTADFILDDVEFNGAASPYAQYVHIGGFNGTPITAPGQIHSNAIDNIYVQTTLINLAKQEYGAYSFDVSYDMPTDTMGKFNFALKGLVWDKYAITFLPNTDPYETSGKVTTTNGTLPRFQGVAMTSWSMGNWGADLAMQYWPSVTDDNDGSRIPQIAQFDVAVSYTFDSRTPWVNGLKVRVGANNVFNKFPPLDKATFTDSNADVATYGGIGRLIFVEASYKF